MSNAVTIAQSGSAPVITGFKNRVINGDFRIDQRNLGTAVSAPINSSTYIADRTMLDMQGASGTASVQRVNDGPPNFQYSIKATVTGTKSITTINDFADFQHTIEGTFVTDFNFGTVSATNLALSFWVKSSVTGVFCGTLFNNLANKTCPQEYTISSANIWQYVTLVFPGDTTASFSLNNLSGITVRIAMATGSGRQFPAGVWSSGNGMSTANQTNLFATLGATFQIAGLQLEAGTASTSFDLRPITIEQLLCYRYYWKNTTGFSLLMARTGGYKSVTWQRPATMRISPVETLTASEGSVYSISSTAEQVQIGWLGCADAGHSYINQYTANAEF